MSIQFLTKVQLSSKLFRFAIHTILSKCTAMFIKWIKLNIYQIKLENPSICLMFITRTLAGISRQNCHKPSLTVTSQSQQECCQRIGPARNCWRPSPTRWTSGSETISVTESEPGVEVVETIRISPEDEIINAPSDLGWIIKLRMVARAKRSWEVIIWLCL